MEINILSSDKNEIELSVSNVTLAEVLRVYLYQAGVDFAAWRREHPSKPVIFRISSSKGVKKVVAEAIEAIKKDCDSLTALLKK